MTTKQDQNPKPNYAAVRELRKLELESKRKLKPKKTQTTDTK